MTEWHPLLRNRNTSDERVLTDERGDTTAALLDEFVADLDGDTGDLVSSAAASRVQPDLDAVATSDGDRVRPLERDES